MLRSKTCHKCGGRMGEGLLLVRDSSGGTNAADWLEGPREKTWYGLKVKGKTSIPLVAYRCERCGLVEQYAEEPLQTGD